MSNESYWTRITSDRIRRRALLKSTAGLGVGAAALSMLGCGGSDSGGASKAETVQDKSGLLTVPQDTSAKATPGGILPSYFTADNPTFDGHNSLSAQTSTHNDYAYARLVGFHVSNATKGEKLSSAVDPYAAASWEVSPDGTTYTFKLQPNGALDPRPPTNGRILDANDVVFSWNRFKATHRSKGLLSNEVNPNAPVQSVTAPDARTVVFKLAFPSVSLLQALSFSFYFMLHPKEADGGFDPRQTMRGSGPWMLTDYKPSVSFTYRKNPGFFKKDRPYIDGIDGPIVLEYAQGLAQLKAGNLYSYNVRQEDIVQTKQDKPAMQMLANDSDPITIAGVAFFGFRNNSPFRDERLRRAMSMLIDRDLFIDTRYNLPTFAKQGLPTEKRWATIVSPGEESFWMDPKGSEFGENARYFKYDPGEAKKLVAAAGKSPVEVPFSYIAGNEYGPDHRQDAEILKGMWEAGGDFKLSANVVDYTTVFLPRYSINSPNRDMEGKGGVALAAVAALPEVDVVLGDWYIPGGTYYKFDSDYPADAQWESLMKAQRTEFDLKKRQGIIKDIQRHAAGKMYTIHRPGAALGFGIAQPYLQNAGAFISRNTNTVQAPSPSSTSLEWWLDKSKM